MLKFKTVRSLIFLASLHACALAQNTVIRSSSFDMGFGVVNGSTSQVKSITGEPVAGVAKGTSYVVSSGFLADTVVQSPATSVAENQTVPSVYSLKQNYPNPFNPSTTIAYELPRRSVVTIGVFNILGQLVSPLVNEQKEAGGHSIVWDGRGVGGIQASTGVYFYRIYARSLEDVTDFTGTKKLVLLK